MKNLKIMEEDVVVGNSNMINKIYDEKFVY